MEAAGSSEMGTLCGQQRREVGTLEQAVHLGSDVVEAKYRIRELGISDSVEQGGQMSLLKPGNNTVPIRASGHSSLCVYVCMYMHVLETDTPMAPDCSRAMAPGVTSAAWATT